MANTKSTQHEIDLTSELNLNKFKADIKPYAGFNERNSPYYGGCLSPLYIKDLGEVNQYIKYYKGHKWETKNGKLYKDDTEVMSFDNTQFVKTRVSELSGFKNKDIKDFYNTDNYVEIDNGKVIIWHSGIRTEVTGTYIGSKYDRAGDYVVVVDDLSSNNNYTVYYNQYLGTGIESITIEKNVGPIIDQLFIGVNSYIIQINTFYYNKSSRTFLGVKMNGVETSYLSNDGKTLYHQESDGWHSEVISRDGRFIHTGYWAHLPIAFIDESYVYGVTFYKNPQRGYTLYIHKISSIDNPAVLINGCWCIPLSGETRSESTDDDLNGGQTCISVKDSIISAFAGKANGGNGVYAYVLPNGCTTSATACYTVYKSEKNETYLSPIGEIVVEKNKWRIIYSNEEASVGDIIGISYNSGNSGFRDPYIRLIGTLLTSRGSVSKVNFRDSSRIVYFDTDLQDWVILETINGNNSFRFIDNYVVINTTSYYNCYSLSSGNKYHWGTDCCNAFAIKTILQSDYKNTFLIKLNNFPLWDSSDSGSISIGAAQNTNYKSDYPPSAVLGSRTVYIAISIEFLSRTLFPLFLPEPYDPANIELFFDKKYKISYYCTGINTNQYVSYDLYGTKIEEALVGTDYPGDIRNNLPLLFDVTSGPLDVDIVNFGSDVSFFLIYYDNKQRLQYYNSSITEFEHFFIIQGQAYGIARNKIYSVAYSGGVVQSSQPIVAIDGLTFVGNTIYNAYFYSKTSKAIYSFGADNNLQLFTQADTITGSTGSNYTISTGSLILGTPEATYVLNERFGAYRLNDITHFTYADQNENSVTLVTDDHAYEVSYEEQDTEDGWVKQDIILDTSFYGAGSNVVSVNDCWYIRVTDPEHGEGEVKLAVSTLTDIGRTTETKTVKVKSKDWDELTDTVYIRFQPKLQRAVGVSLHIESPFKVGYIGVGATPETLQLNKVNI